MTFVLFKVAAAAAAAAIIWAMDINAAIMLCILTGAATLFVGGGNIENGFPGGNIGNGGGATAAVVDGTGVE